MGNASITQAPAHLNWQTAGTKSKAKQTAQAHVCQVISSGDQHTQALCSVTGMPLCQQQINCSARGSLQARMSVSESSRARKSDALLAHS